MNQSQSKYKTFLKPVGFDFTHATHLTKLGFGGLLNAEVKVELVKTRMGNEVLVIDENGNGWHGKMNDLTPIEPKLTTTTGETISVSWDIYIHVRGAYLNGLESAKITKFGEHFINLATNFNK